ncbi:hypothetical protein D3C80_605760 [compost metagenome]
MKVTYSSELISNFKLADIAAPEKQFTALQTDNGCSLLFSVSTDNELYVTQETPGHETGWVKTELSKEVLAKHPGGAVKTFAVAQNAGTNQVDLAMVVAGADTDHLYLSLGNSADSTAWIATPKWDAVVSLEKLTIANVFISQAADGQYIVVDRSRNPDDSQQFVARFYIDTDPARMSSGQAWKSHAMPVDLELANYASCLGRRATDKLDGIYTLGHIGRHDTLVYQPLYDRFKPGHPTTAVRLQMPDDSAPSAIAGALLNDKGETDLYVAGHGALYYFPSTGQQDGAQAIKVMGHAIFEDVHSLFAFTTPEQVTVWGLNRAQQLFYTSCARDSVATPAAWSYPLPILGQVQGVSPYINRANSGQVFFAHAGSGLFKKASRTLDASAWKFDNILLPVQANVKAKAKKFSSYTTRIQVTDDSNRPLGKVQEGPRIGEPITVSLGAEHRVGLYINNHYYVLSPTPIDVPVDLTGGLMIVEWVDSLAATELYIHRDGQPPITIDPMDKPLQQAAQLDSEDKVAKAVVRKANGEVEKSLMGPDPASGAQGAFVEGMRQLAMAHKGLKSRKSGTLLMASAELTRMPLSTLASGNMVSFAVSKSSVQVTHHAPEVRLAALHALAATETVHSAWADFVLWLKSLAEYVVHLIEDTLNKVWHFVVEVAGKISRFVLDVVVKIVGALETVFQWIKTAIEDVLKFLSFLFDWGDIVRTKEVFKKLLVFSAYQAADDIDWIKGQFDGLMKKATDSLDDWAGLAHSSDWLKRTNSDQSVAQRTGQVDLQHAHSTPSQYLTQHFNSNVKNSTVDNSNAGGGADDGLAGLVHTVLKAFEMEQKVFDGLVAALKAEVFDNFNTLSMAEILQRVVVRLVDALALTTKVIGDTVFDLLAQLVRTAVGVLDAKIYIPVLSEILEDVFGLAPFSILDVLCLIGAVPATIIYKIATGQPLFTATDGFSDKVIAATDLKDLRARFAAHQPVLLAADAAVLGDGKSNLTPIVLDKETQRRLFISGHAVSGILSIFVLPVITLLDVEVEDFFVVNTNPVSIWATLCSIACAGTAGYARIFADPYPIKNEVFSTIAVICTGATIVGKVIHGAAGMGYWRIKGDRTTEMYITKLGSFWDGLFAVVSLVPSCYHFYELSQLEDSDDRNASIIGETTSVCTYLARVSEFGARMSSSQPELQLVLALVMSGMYLCYGILQCAEAGVGGKPLPPVK